MADVRHAHATGQEGSGANRVVADDATTFPLLFAASWAAQGGALPAADPDLGPGQCELCGAVAPRVPWRPKSNWTAFDTHAYPGAGAICIGCALLLDGGPEVNEAGRAKRWTLYTLACDGRSAGWALKNAKPQIAAWIDNGWSVSVADGGKKHVAYLAPLAVPGRVVCAIDGELVDAARGDWQELRALVDAAYQAGVPKRSLAAGALTHDDIRRLGLQWARSVQDGLAAWCGTSVLRLAVWLATRQEDSR